MEPKKKRKLIIIIMVLIFLILLTGFTYIYLVTDLFKSNKELFFQYMKQIGEEKEGWIESNLEEYFQKQENTPYQNEGNLSMKYTDKRESLQSDEEKNVKVVFHGQTENSTSKRLQNISLNYSDKVKFPFNYKKVGNIQGIQTDFVGSKYIATKGEDNQLGEIGNLIGKLEKRFDLVRKRKEIEPIQEYCFQLLEEELQETDFKKIEEKNQKAYQLTINGEKIKDLLIKVLEWLKNDPQILEKINEILKIYENSIKITMTDLDSVIREINNQNDLKEEKLEITVYQTAGKLKRFTIKTNVVEWDLEKQLTENQLEYHLKLQLNEKGKQSQIEFTTRFIGLQELRNVVENHQLRLNFDEAQYEYLYQNQMDFVDSVEIQGFSKENSMILEDYPEEQVQDFKKAVQERLEMVNQKQMEELGIEENPLQNMIPKIWSHQKEIEEEEVNTFNQKFENYESTNLQGVTVKGLLSTIQLNNQEQENKNKKIKEIHFDGEEYEVTDQNILLLKSTVELETAYRVEFEKEEETGIIYRVVINKK